MSFLAKMFVHDRVINVLHTNIHLYQQCDPTTHLPNAKTNGGLFQVVIEADEHTDLLNTVISGTMCSGYIRFFKRDGMSKLIDYEFFDAYIIDISTHFNAYSPDPMTDTLTFSPGILRFGDVVYEKWWKVTDLNRAEVAETVDNGPSISSVNWLNENGEAIKNTAYDTNTSVLVEVKNPQGGSVEIVIEKEDGSEIEEGKKTISFTEYVNEDGMVELSSFKIKKEWENFKNAVIDKLIVVAKINGSQKKSELELVPQPKVIVDFRPSKGFDGEYGFDYMRHKKDKDDHVTYEDILGTNREFDKKNKKWVEKFKKYPDNKKYKSLRDDYYKTVTFDWHKDTNGEEIEYIQSWLALYPNQKAKLSLQIETIENAENADLKLEYDKTYFKLNADTIPAQSKGKKRLDDHLEIECIKEFSTDQTIKVVHGERQLGQLSLLKNDKANRKKIDIVFVEVKTSLKKGSSAVGNSSGGKKIIEKYLEQSLIKSNVVTEKLDLSSDAIFNKECAKSGKGYIENRTGLLDYLNKKVGIKYKDYLKIYFIPDECPTFDKAGKKTGRVNGQAKDINSDAVVLFKGHNSSTATHEALHALGLYHTFSSSADYSYKKGETYNIMDYSHQAQYGSKKRVLTWLWQWKKLWKNALVKPE